MAPPASLFAQLTDDSADSILILSLSNWIPIRRCLRWYYHHRKHVSKTTTQSDQFASSQRQLVSSKHFPKIEHANYRSPTSKMPLIQLNSRQVYPHCQQELEFQKKGFLL